jgi:hypothetical protein
MADFSVHYLFLERLGFKKSDNDGTVYRVMGSSSVWVRVYDSSTYGWDSYSDHTLEIYFGDLERLHDGRVRWPDKRAGWNHRCISIYSTEFKNEGEIRDLIDSVLDKAMAESKRKMAEALAEYETIVGITW